jgi:hypothetical protein
MRGLTTTKGAILTARKRMIFPRAASGLTERKSESASAIAIAVSPATINE